MQSRPLAFHYAIGFHRNIHPAANTQTPTLAVKNHAHHTIANSLASTQTGETGRLARQTHLLIPRLEKLSPDSAYAHPRLGRAHCTAAHPAAGGGGSIFAGESGRRTLLGDLEYLGQRWCAAAMNCSRALHASCGWEQDTDDTDLFSLETHMTKSKLEMTNFPALDTPARLLLGPGPSLVDPRVLRVMATPLVGHLDPTFLQLMDRTQLLLRYVFETENRLTYPVSGTGSAGMESVIANLIEPGDRAVIAVNGYFGTRLVEMARRYGAEVVSLTRPWGEVFTPQEIEAALSGGGPTKLVALVQAETSTGALQPLDEIAKTVHAHAALLVVDAVTSLGGLPVRVDATEIDACYSGTQKCLSCPPGLAPVTFGARAQAAIEQRRTAVTNWYLDASLLIKYWGKERTYHHTAPISANYALYEGLRLVAEEGLR